MRVIAILATYNEERFVAGCLENLIGQGLQVYLVDNDSTDRTVAIAERYAGRGLIGIETLPRAGLFSLRQQCARKETLAATLDADWFIHVDADQIILPARSNSEPRAGLRRSRYRRLQRSLLSPIRVRPCPGSSRSRSSGLSANHALVLPAQSRPSLIHFGRGNVRMLWS